MSTLPTLFAVSLTLTSIAAQESGPYDIKIVHADGSAHKYHDFFVSVMSADEEERSLFETKHIDGASSSEWNELFSLNEPTELALRVYDGDTLIGESRAFSLVDDCVYIHSEQMSLFGAESEDVVMTCVYSWNSRGIAMCTR